jgi:hypothetical protein
MKNKIIWPSKFIVDYYNGQPIWLKTGPYNKSIIGETQEDINNYLVHLRQLYLEEKAQYLERRDSELHAEQNKMIGNKETMNL